MKCNGLFVNILHRIFCFITLVYMDYLVFLRRLKHGDPWLGELSPLARLRHLLSERSRLRGRDEVLQFHIKLMLSGLHVQLVLGVADDGP
jgi:hypothetical protein